MTQPALDLLNTGDYIFVIFNQNHDMLVQITYDGRLEFGPCYAPDLAAQIFWEAIAAHIPRIAQ